MGILPRRYLFILLSLLLAIASRCYGSSIDTATQLLTGCGKQAILISQIQGTQPLSPLLNQTVTIEAQVTALFQQPGQLNGFFLQEEPQDQDQDLATSEGIFVYLNQNKPHIEPNDIIRLTATVTEFHGRTQLHQIRHLVRCKHNAAQAIPIQLTDLYQHNLSSMEGMLVSTTKIATVIDTHYWERYGELRISLADRIIHPLQTPSPRAMHDSKNQTPPTTLIVDDGRTGKHLSPSALFNTPSRDQLIRGAKIAPFKAILDFGFEQYRLHPISDINISPAMISKPPKKPSNALRIVTLNTNHFFNGEPDKKTFLSKRGPQTWHEYRIRRDALLEQLQTINADIIVLNEIENDGFSQKSTIADLTQALSALTGSPHQFAKLNIPRVGNSELSNHIIFNTIRVNGDTSLTTTEPPFDRRHRPPLLQFLTYKGLKLTIIANHFKSKGSCPKKGSDRENQDTGHGQGCWSQARREAVSGLLAWLDQLNIPPQYDIVILAGDFNSYYGEDTLELLSNNHFQNVIPKEVANTNYTYNYRETSGQLDHILVSEGLQQHLLKQNFHIWHRNSDAYVSLRRHPEFQQLHPSQIDHDPLILDLFFKSK